MDEDLEERARAAAARILRQRRHGSEEVSEDDDLDTRARAAAERIMLKSRDEGGQRLSRHGVLMIAEEDETERAAMEQRDRRSGPVDIGLRAAKPLLEPYSSPRDPIEEEVERRHKRRTDPKIVPDLQDIGKPTDPVEIRKEVLAERAPPESLPELAVEGLSMVADAYLARPVRAAALMASDVVEAIGTGGVRRDTSLTGYFDRSEPGNLLAESRENVEQAGLPSWIGSVAGLGGEIGLDVSTLVTAGASVLSRVSVANRARLMAAARIADKETRIAELAAIRSSMKADESALLDRLGASVQSGDPLDAIRAAMEADESAARRRVLLGGDVAPKGRGSLFLPTGEERVIGTGSVRPMRPGATVITDVDVPPETRRLWLPSEQMDAVVMEGRLIESGDEVRRAPLGSSVTVRVTGDAPKKGNLIGVQPGGDVIVSVEGGNRMYVDPEDVRLGPNVSRETPSKKEPGKGAATSTGTGTGTGTGQLTPVNIVRSPKRGNFLWDFIRFGRVGGQGGEEIGAAYHALQEAKARGAAKALSDFHQVDRALKSAPPEAVTAYVEDVYRGRLITPQRRASLGPAAKPLAEVAERIKELGRERARRGLIDSSTVEQYDDTVLRLFRNHIEKKSAALEVDSSGMGIRQFIDRGDGYVAMSESMTKKDAEKILQAMGVKDRRAGGTLMSLVGDDEKVFVKFDDSPAGQKSLSEFVQKAKESGFRGIKEKAPLTADERLARGGEVDFPSAIRATVLAGERDLALADFFDAVASGHDRSGLPLAVSVPKDRLPPPGYVQLPDDPKLASLKGKWVQPETMRLINGFGEDVNGWTGVIDGVARGWAGDALNTPRMWFTQVLGNMSLFDLTTGISRLNPANAKYRRAARELVTEWHKTGVMPRRLREAVDSGLIVTPPTQHGINLADEIDDMFQAHSTAGRMKDLGTEAYRIVTGSPLAASPARGLGGALQGAARAYSEGGDIVDVALGAAQGSAQSLGLGAKFGETSRSVAERLRMWSEADDTRTRLAAWMKRVDRDMSKKDAAEWVNSHGQNYIRTGGVSEIATGRATGIRGADSVLQIFGSRFFRFKETAVRSIIAGLGDSDPAVRAGTAAALAMAAIMKATGRAVTQAATGRSNDEITAAQARNPKAILVPGTDGGIYAINSESAFVDPIRVAMLAEGDLRNDVLLASPVVSTGIRLQQLAMAESPRNTTDPFTGAPIAYKKHEGLTETAGQAAVRVTQANIHPYSPGGRGTRQIADLLTKETIGQSGEKHGPIKTILGLTVGQIRDVTPRDSARQPGDRTLTQEEGLLIGYLRDVESIMADARHGVRDVELGSDKARIEKAKERAKARSIERWADKVEEMLDKGFKVTDSRLGIYDESGRVRNADVHAVLKNRGRIKGN